MWRNETLWLGESRRLTGRHPFNQTVFQDDKGNPQLDWRGDYEATYPVLDDGRMVATARQYEEAVKSTYDPRIKQYFDEAIACGTLFIDDGSVKFPVNGEQVTVTELLEKAQAYEKCPDPAKRMELAPYYREYRRLVANEDLQWVHTDSNFEALKALTYAKLHVRYDETGAFDPSCMSKYEKLLAFYGYGVEKDEKPLRDDAGIWTTSLNVGANCARKEIKIRFWESDEVIVKAKF